MGRCADLVLDRTHKLCTPRDSKPSHDGALASSPAGPAEPALSASEGSSLPNRQTLNICWQQGARSSLPFGSIFSMTRMKNVATWAVLQSIISAYDYEDAPLSRLHEIAGCDNPGRKADVIFVHGLGGDYAATWRHDQNSSWPHWLAEEFSDVGVWSLEYAASPTKLARVRGWFTGDRDAGYSMALPDRAGQVLDRMVQKHLGERPLFFICHSLGGLLVKQILRKADDADDDPRKKQVATQTRAVLFLATPHNGAELASLLDAFRTLFGTTVIIDDLRAHDAHLLDLYNWYRNHSLGLGIRTVTYYEKRPVMGVLPIVNATSSQAGVGPDAVPLDEDHLSIAKPRDRDEQVCDAARDLLNDYVLVSRSATPEQPQATPVVAAASEPQRVIVQVQSPSAGGTVRVPCELPPAAEKHFGRQTELKQLTERLRAGKNSAVVGPAGMGKTALAAEAVRSVVGDSLANSPFPDGVVFLDLYKYRGQAEPAWNNLSNALRGPEFRDSSPARERATEACRSLQVLIILEGGEEADGRENRTTIPELYSVFSPQNRYLLMTRLSTQSVPAEGVELKESLYPDDAADLLDSLTQGRVTGSVRDQVLTLMEGHPLALTWAGNLLARDDDEPKHLVDEWQAGGLPSLSDPKKAEHTLQWLFDRSVRGLDDNARRLLAAAGLLARAPFPLAIMVAALDDLADSVLIARATLKSLVQRGLLRRSEESDHWQFTHVLGYRFARKETGSDPELCERLGSWLSGHLQAVLANNASYEAAPSLTRALEHGAALLRADDHQQLWTSLGNNFLYDVSDRLTVLGRLDLVGLALGAVADWLLHLPQVKAQTPDWLRERSILLSRQGDVLREHGDLTRALAAFRESVALSRPLAESDLLNTLWQRDLCGHYNKVGIMLRDQGDLDGSLAAHREALKVIRRVTEAEPSNKRWQRDLVISQGWMGDVLHKQGDLEGALVTYRALVAAMQSLAETDRSNADWQEDITLGQDRIGDILRDQGDLAGALTAYSDSLAIRRRLTETDPANAGWQRHLAFSLTRVSQLYARQGDLPEALPLAEESLEIAERLAALDPTNATWQHDVSVSRSLVARLLVEETPS
jgi:tetratricopeptide (TPR) repeat protein